MSWMQTLNVELGLEDPSSSDSEHSSRDAEWFASTPRAQRGEREYLSMLLANCFVSYKEKGLDLGLECSSRLEEDVRGALGLRTFICSSFFRSHPKNKSFYRQNWFLFSPIAVLQQVEESRL